MMRYLKGYKPNCVTRAREYVAAALDHPQGMLCGWCNRPNTFFDDCGFFCITPVSDDTRVTCERCYRGPLGEAHIARYGLGDR